MNFVLPGRSGSGDGGELIDRVSLSSSLSFIQSQTFPSESIFSLSRYTPYKIILSLANLTYPDFGIWVRVGATFFYILNFIVSRVFFSFFMLLYYFGND